MPVKDARVLNELNMVLQRTQRRHVAIAFMRDAQNEM